MTIICGDCLDVMETFPDNHFSAIVTDPPYGLHFMGKNWDSFKFKSNVGKGTNWNLKVGEKRKVNCSDSDGSYLAGTYDDRRNDEFQFFIYQFGLEAKRIVKPGGHILMFGAPRRYHRQVSGLEDAGWEIRDCLMWIFGSGFPKSHNHFGIEGYGTALKPAHEPILLCMKPCDGTFKQNAEKWGQAGINIDGCRIGNDIVGWGGNGSDGFLGDRPEYHKALKSNQPGGRPVKGRWPANVIFEEESSQLLGDPSRFFFIARKDKYDIISPWELQEESLLFGKKRENANSNRNIGTYGNKPTGQFLPDTISIIEMGTHSIINFPILSVSKQMLIGNCTLESEKIIKQSEVLYIEAVSVAENGECLIHFQRERMEPIKAIVRNVRQSSLENGGEITENIGINTIGIDARKRAINTIKNISTKTENELTHRDGNGIVKRFFYCAKASSGERNEGLEGMPEKSAFDNPNGNMGGNMGSRSGPRQNNHPTVKPLKLMEYLIKLIMPPKDGILLDPFAGSGTTILAAKRLGFDAIGIEKEAEYCEIARKRCEVAKKDEIVQLDLFSHTKKLSA